MSSNSYVSEIPTGNSPTSATNDPVLTQGITHTVFLGPIVHSYFLTILGCDLTAGRQSDGDEYSDDDVDKDSPYPGMCCFELVYQARFSLEVSKRESWLDRLALSLHTVTIYN